jgi:transposase-like protein
MIARPAIFKWRQTEPGLILCAVRWYRRYSLSLRDVEELLEERGLNVDHTTVWRWVQDYGPELEQRLQQHLKPTNKSWRVDEAYVRVCPAEIVIREVQGTRGFQVVQRTRENLIHREFENTRRRRFLTDLTTTGDSSHRRAVRSFGIIAQ